LTQRKSPAPSPRTRRWEHLPDAFGKVEDISDALIVREGHNFLLTDGTGNVPADNGRGLGLYGHDTRYLSVYDLKLQGEAPVYLLSTADSGFGEQQVMGNHRFLQDGRVVGRCTIEVMRERLLERSLHETLTITNHNRFPVQLDLNYAFDADFASIFEVRGHAREQKGHLSPAEVEESAICYRYLGADSEWRSTTISFESTPNEIDEHSATFVLDLDARSQTTLELRVLIHQEDAEPAALVRRRLSQSYSEWHESFASLHTDNESFEVVLQRSLSDLRMLWTKGPHEPGYPAAGTPWFATLFGRDSIIASLQTLPFQPSIARECLALLARYQGQVIDAFHCEEPGKILHEARDDELTRINELPYRRYYGSVDSTPLFLLLAAEYFHWTNDHELLQSLRPAIEAGLRWLRDYGDMKGDGFIRHRSDSLDGLRNQGWKDSIDGIVHADGSLLDGPIALAEVQGYAYAAFVRLAATFATLGEPKFAESLRERAEALKRRFNQAFWLPDKARVAMALDGGDRPSEVMSSNAGQVLWSGILERRRAEHVRNALFRNDMFTGWGLRTLSTDAASYYPLGYHVGSVWPHDNGIIANGLKRYGFRSEVNEIATALFDAARSFPLYRLPELFGGQPRAEYQPPVPYPVACRPQAWTAGAFLHLIQAMLGLHPDAPNGVLYLVRPLLPFWLRVLRIDRIPFANGSITLELRAGDHRTSVKVETQGDVRVVMAASNRGLPGLWL
jgi:glycogen debranching enzyme